MRSSWSERRALPMARAGLLLGLAVVVVAVVAPLRASAAADAGDVIYLQPRGFPVVRCSLGHSARDGVDFWMRGTSSRLLYGCRLDTDAHVREQILAGSRNGRLTLLPDWNVLLYSDGAKQSPELTANRSPYFTCVTDGRGTGAPSPLPDAVFHLTARRRTAGRTSQWYKCFLVKTRQQSSTFNIDVPLVTITFRGGAPALVCGIGDSSKSVVPAAELKGILGSPYACYLATYVDFPALKGPPAGLVFQRHVLNKWTPKLTNPNDDAFPPFECWPVEEDAERAFDFDIAVDGKLAQRCRFEGGCPLCGQVLSTQPSQPSSTQMSTSPDDTSTTVLTYAKRVHFYRKGNTSRPLLFERRLCTYHSLDEKNNTVVHQIPCFG